MALVNREVGIAIDAQSVEGVANSTIAGLSGSLALLNGIILGDVDSGTAKSGVTHSFTRRLREKGAVTGGFTELASDFLEEEISLTFAFPMAGPRANTLVTPVDSDFEHDMGIKALLGACGLAGAADPGGVGWQYTPADVAIATMRLFDSGVAWVIRDIRGDWSLSQTPGEIGIMTCALTGVVDSFATIAFPSFAFAEQASVNAPSVKSTGSAWSFVRGWTDLTISCSNSIESIPDSNSTTGKSFDQNGRVITLSMNIRDDSSDLDYTRAQLIRQTAPVDDMTYSVGSAAAGLASAIAYKLALNNLEVLDYQPDVAGRKASSSVTAKCTGVADGDEFSLTFF